MARTKLTRNRIGWWLAALLLLATIALTYRLTRPPELVWWTSPLIPGTAKRVHLLIPFGWEQYAPGVLDISLFALQPKDRCPPYLRWLLHCPESPDFITISTRSSDTPGWIGKDTVIELQPDEHGERAVTSTDGMVRAHLCYKRSDAHILRSTYQQVCNSLRIE